MKNKILVTGGDGRFAKVLAKYNQKLNLFFVNKKECNILNENSINKAIKKNQTKNNFSLCRIIRPMSVHEKNIEKSIDANIIGTANIVKACKRKK